MFKKLVNAKWLLFVPGRIQAKGSNVYSDVYMDKLAFTAFLFFFFFLGTNVKAGLVTTTDRATFARLVADRHLGALGIQTFDNAYASGSAVYVPEVLFTGNAYFDICQPGECNSDILSPSYRGSGTDMKWHTAGGFANTNLVSSAAVGFDYTGYYSGADYRSVVGGFLTFLNGSYQGQTIPFSPGFFGVIGDVPLGVFRIEAATSPRGAAWGRLDNYTKVGGPGSSQDNPLYVCLAIGCPKIKTGHVVPYWYDPPFSGAYEFKTLDGSKFTTIADFPMGYGDALTVRTGNTVLGTYGPGDNLNFLLGGVSSFVISGIDPAIDPLLAESFTLKLALDTEGGMFEVSPFASSSSPEPSTFVLSFGILLLLWGRHRRSIFVAARRTCTGHCDSTHHRARLQQHGASQASSRRLAMRLRSLTRTV